MNKPIAGNTAHDLRNDPPPIPLPFVIIARLVWPAAIVALLWMAYKGGAWTDMTDAVTRYRLSGTWHVEGSFADWRFGSDGTWMEDALIDTRGSYILLEDGRIHINGLFGATMEFQHSFMDRDLLLKGINGTPFSFRLTRKD